MPHPSWAQRPPSQGVYIVCSARILILVCTHNVHHALEGGSPRPCMFRTCTYICICTGALTRHACAYVAQVCLVRTLVHVVALCACVRACVLARVTSDKKCQAAQATWWVALEIPAARIARRGFIRVMQVSGTVKHYCRLNCCVLPPDLRDRGF